MTDPCKVVLIGESGVGKTCIIAQFINKTFDPNVVSSLTSQYIRKNIELPEGKVSKWIYGIQQDKKNIVH